MGLLWRKVVQRASGAVLRRKKLAPDALLGRLGEEAAYWHLRHQGYVMVQRNYRPPGLRGEIDLIGWDGEVLVFVEVKSRRAGGMLEPESSVDREKVRHLAAAARQYRRQANQISKPFRFDIVSIVVRDISSPADMEIKHFRDAFREADRPQGTG